MGGTLTADFSDGIAIFDDLTLSTVSGTPNVFKVVAQSGSNMLSTLDTSFCDGQPGRD